MNVRMTNAEQELKPAGASQSLPVSNSAVAAPVISEQHSHVMVDVIGADARMTLDGTDPVGGTSGHLLANGMHRIWHRDLVRQARFIRDASTDLAIYVTPLTL